MWHRKFLLKSLTFKIFRPFHTTSRVFLQAKQLVVKNYGDPSNVVEMEDVSLNEELKENQVLVKFLASPINPADINTIQGNYAIKPNCPFIPGNEAVMKVMEKGRNVSELSNGDQVIPASNAIGTWRTYGIFEETDLFKIPSDIDYITASTIAVNPCTAYRLLHDFVNLRNGDVIIQNCANSAVGLAVIQLANWMGVKTINVVRDRPNLAELKEYMKSIGATVVVSEAEIKTNEDVKSLPTPVLGLNGVSGRPTLELIKRMHQSATLVTYGGMSKQPLLVPVGSLIFTDLTFKGFWMTRWNKIHGNDEQRMAMLEKLFELCRENKFQNPPHTKVLFNDYKKALNMAMPADGKIGKKQILVFDNN